MDLYTFLKEWWGALAALLGTGAALVGAYWRLHAKVNAVAATAAAEVAEVRRAHEWQVQRLTEQRAEDAARSKESRDLVQRELEELNSSMNAKFDMLLTEIRLLRQERRDA